MSKVQFPAQQRDKFTGFPATVTSDHAYIHDGIGFSLSGTTGSLAAAATYALTIQTPANGKYIHLRPAGLSSTANTLQMRLAQGTTFSSGSTLTANNKNRNSKNASACTITGGVTIVAEGSILEYSQVGAGSNAANATGGSNDGSANEWVLKPGTTYSFRFENVGSTTATVGYFNLFWYEEGSGS